MDEPEKKGVKYRCTKGHEWKEDAAVVQYGARDFAFNFHFPDGTHDKIDELCLWCMRDLYIEQFKDIGRIYKVE
jgi:hypothetical protein